MLSLAFTLTPFLYFGVRALGDRAALIRLIRLGLVTAALLAVVLLPPLVNDWHMFAAKAGQDSVTPDTLERTALMIAGTGHAVVGIAFTAFAVLGWMRWWTRDRELAGYALTHRGRRVRRDRDRTPELGPVRARVRALPDPGRAVAICCSPRKGWCGVAAAQERACGLHRRRDRRRARGERAAAGRSGTRPTSSRATSASSSTTTTRTTRT